jgi:hypothetical protein
VTPRLYHNPVLAADWSDPDAIRVGDDGRTATLRIHLEPRAVCRFAAAPGQAPPVPLGTPFVATPGHWVGATVGLFAAAPLGDGPAGHAEISRFTMVGS